MGSVCVHQHRDGPAADRAASPLISSYTRDDKEDSRSPGLRGQSSSQHPLIDVDILPTLVAAAGGAEVSLLNQIGDVFITAKSVCVVNRSKGKKCRISYEP